MPDENASVSCPMCKQRAQSDQLVCDRCGSLIRSGVTNVVALAKLEADAAREEAERSGTRRKGAVAGPDAAALYGPEAVVPVGKPLKAPRASALEQRPATPAAVDATAAHLSADLDALSALGPRSEPLFAYGHGEESAPTMAMPLSSLADSAADEDGASDPGASTIPGTLPPHVDDLWIAPTSDEIDAADLASTITEGMRPAVRRTGPAETSEAIASLIEAVQPKVAVPAGVVVAAPATPPPSTAIPPAIDDDAPRRSKGKALLLLVLLLMLSGAAFAVWHFVLQKPADSSEPTGTKAGATQAAGPTEPRRPDEDGPSEGVAAVEPVDADPAETDVPADVDASPVKDEPVAEATPVRTSTGPAPQVDLATILVPGNHWVYRVHHEPAADGREERGAQTFYIKRVVKSIEGEPPRLKAILEETGGAYDLRARRVEVELDASDCMERSVQGTKGAAHMCFADGTAATAEAAGQEVPVVVLSDGAKRWAFAAEVGMVFHEWPGDAGGADTMQLVGYQVGGRSAGDSIREPIVCDWDFQMRASRSEERKLRFSGQHGVDKAKLKAGGEDGELLLYLTNGEKETMKLDLRPRWVRIWQTLDQSAEYLVAHIASDVEERIVVRRYAGGAMTEQVLRPTLEEGETLSPVMLADERRCFLRLQAEKAGRTRVADYAFGAGGLTLEGGSLVVK